MSNDKVKTAKLQQVIRKVLEAHGRLEKAEILTYVSTFLNVREKQIRASLHKSLKSMSDDNELQMHYFYADGTPMDEADIWEIIKHSGKPKTKDDPIKNYSCKWSLPGFEYQAMGVKILQDRNGDFTMPNNLLLHDYKIAFAESNADPHRFSLLFSVGDKVIRLALDRDECPASIVVARTTPNLNLIEANKELTGNYGSRASFLFLPTLTLSSCKPGKNLGHALIKFIDKDHVTIQDLRSRNGTKVIKLSNKQMNALEEVLAGQSGGATVTVPFGSNIEVTPGFEFNVSERTKFELPILLLASDNCRILIK